MHKFKYAHKNENIYLLENILSFRFQPILNANCIKSYFDERKERVLNVKVTKVGKKGYGVIYYYPTMRSHDIFTASEFDIANIKVKMQNEPNKFHEAIENFNEAKNNPIDWLIVDCMREIFKSISLDDMCNAADVSLSFRSLAKQEIKRRTVSLEETTSTRDILRFLRKFGHEIRFLRMERCDEMSHVINSISDKCNALEEMRINYLDVPDDEMRLRAIFLRLQTLHVYEFAPGALRTIAAAENLEELSLGRNEQNLEDLTVLGVFPKLKKVSLVDCTLSDDCLRNFLLTHTQIKMAKIPITNATYQIVMQNLPNIEKLYCHFQGHDVQFETFFPIPQKLSKIKLIDSNGGAVSAVSAIIKQIQKSKVNNVAFINVGLKNKQIKSIAKLTNLEKLKFEETPLGVEKLINLCDKMTRLKKLCFRSEIAVTEEQLLKIVSKCTKMVKLIIDCVQIDQKIHEKLRKLVQQQKKEEPFRIRLYNNKSLFTIVIPQKLMTP